MPVGRCVRRMALEVLLTCWPPAPLARNTSSRMSSSLELDFDRVVDFGRDVDRGEAGLPLAFGVEGADPHQAVHAGLALQVAVGHRPANGQRRALDAGHVVVLAVENLDLVVVLLGPVDVHPQQHFGPVVGVGAAVAGVDGEDGALGVVGPVEQALELELGDQRFESFESRRRSSAASDSSSSPSRPARRDRRPGDRFVERLEERAQRLQLGDRGLGLLLVVPEAGLRHLFFDGGRLSLLGSVVKESLGVGRSAGGWPRPDRSVPCP